VKVTAAGAAVVLYRRETIFRSLTMHTQTYDNVSFRMPANQPCASLVLTIGGCLLVVAWPHGGGGS